MELKAGEKIELPVEELLRMCFTTPVAIIKKLYPILGKEKTLQLVKDVVWETTSKEPFEPFKSFQDFLREGASELVQKTTEMELLELKENEVSFKMTKCLWAEVFKSMGASEIGRLLVCESDFSRAKVWSPKLELFRTKTIMEGDDYCDIRYVWKE
jgi:hypothetical protein